MSRWNAVQNDRQWTRRIMREEQLMLDSAFERNIATSSSRTSAASKPSVANSVKSVKSGKSSIAGSVRGGKAQILNVEEEAKNKRNYSPSNRSIRTESSRTSVATPKTAGSSVSGITSSSSANIKLNEMQINLEKERQKREAAEKELAMLRAQIQAKK
eukprot:CAMPEP_0114975688 /NCGR_PEP_ID=MMETSP0216-20121206/2246_1 /TAXON_ID=223996 /ORGANISM="Protocruzia adherens, Strain Boccale" /LENGTH=157 /DNA_ID=CAMNT_0002336513 /DNA_START=38 /DNA_END=511 /DNA_ORIENTATION=+